MDKYSFPVRESGGCVDYAVSVARVALGYSPNLPLVPQDGGPRLFGIIGMVGAWFPNHKVRVWCGDVDKLAPMAENVEYMGHTYNYDRVADSILLYTYRNDITSSDGHMVIGLPTPGTGLLIAVERSNDG